MKRTHAITEQQLATRILEIHRQRCQAGADDSEKSLLTSSLLAAAELSGIEVSETHARKAARHLLEMRPLLPPMAFTREQVIRSSRRMDSDEAEGLVDSIMLSGEGKSGSSLGKPPINNFRSND